MPLFFLYHNCMRLNLFVKLFLAFVCMFLITFFFPILRIDNGGTILSAATFLYGILYGFETFRVLSNFTQLKNHVAIENAGILSIYYLAKLVGGEVGGKVEKKVEEYLIAAIDAPLSRHLVETDKEFYAIFEPLQTITIENQHQNLALNYIFEGFYYIPPSRSQIAQLAPRDIDTPEWIILIILALLLIGILVLTRQDSTISLLSTVIFATTVVESLLILDEFDSNRIKEDQLEYESFNQSLKAMGKLAYYPQFAIDTMIIKPPKHIPYRIGRMIAKEGVMHREITTIS